MNCKSEMQRVEKRENLYLEIQPFRPHKSQLNQWPLSFSLSLSHFCLSKKINKTNYEKVI